MAKSIYWYEHRHKKSSKKWFWKRFFKLNNVVFENLLENVRKHRDIKLATKKEGII